MQIDFHHAATYVIARVAGMDHSSASTVAHASQYVDDATNSGLIEFDNGAMYDRISSAHKMLDYRNFEALADHHVWIPFHFLPGNGGLPPEENPGSTFIEKIVCTPNSYVAKEMVVACLERSQAPDALHRLGITLHVYADTWAHQGFAGVAHAINSIGSLQSQEAEAGSIQTRLAEFFGTKFDWATARFVGGVLPLGHGAALSYPDRPYLRWSYRNSQGALIERDNPRDFLIASDAVYRVIRRFLARDPGLEGPGLPERDRAAIDACFRTIVNEDGTARHSEWIKLVKAGAFSFGPAPLEYVATGVGSWRYQALATTKETDDPGDVFPYAPTFLQSDWKLFHNALQAHRLTVLHDILPRYGICAA